MTCYPRPLDIDSIEGPGADPFSGEDLTELHDLLNDDEDGTLSALLRARLENLYGVGKGLTAAQFVMELDALIERYADRIQTAKKEAS